MNVKPSTQIGHNSGRSLEVIAAEIHGLERRNIFEIGKLLAEAREGREHGEWQDWVDEQEFDFGYRTALNYIKAHDLRLKCETVSLLKVPAIIIYDLADDERFSEDDALQAVVKDLDRASKTKTLTVGEAEDVIRFACLRVVYGDYPDATLDGLDYADRGEPWSAAAIEELKQARPETDEAVDEIVKKHSVDPTREESAEKDEEEDEEEDEEPQFEQPKSNRMLTIRDLAKESGKDAHAAQSLLKDIPDPDNAFDDEARECVRDAAETWQAIAEQIGACRPISGRNATLRLTGRH